MKTQATSTPNWPALIKAKRQKLGESQTIFGNRFGVTQVAVFKWESGQSDPPGNVTWWVVNGD